MTEVLLNFRVPGRLPFRMERTKIKEISVAPRNSTSAMLSYRLNSREIDSRCIGNTGRFRVDPRSIVIGVATYHA
jgi:hypothetical protein